MTDAKALRPLPDDEPSLSLTTCSQCAPFRRDQQAWLAAVKECPRCSAILEAYDTEAWSARDEEEGERLEVLEHFDPDILPELDEASALQVELLTGNFDAQRRRAETVARFHHWGLVQRLLTESQQLRNRRPRVSRARAELAVTLAENLHPDRYHPAWIADLNAKALAYLARAERRLGRFREAERSMTRASVWALRGTNGGRARSFLDDLATSHRLQRISDLPARPATGGSDGRDKISPCPSPSSNRPRRVPEA